jgi:ribosomal protein S18 acetylase RimI-like enzyme
MKIRRAIPEDAGQIQKLMKKVWLDTYPNEEFGITKASINKFVKDWDSQEQVRIMSKNIESKKPNNDHLVAIVDDKIVANMLVVNHGLRQLYIDPKYQYKGIGSGMLDKSKIDSLEVVKYNLQAVNFYKKHGFIIDQESMADFGDIKLPTYIMKRP